MGGARVGDAETAASRRAFEEQKRAYWRLRDELLERYLHQWVAIADGTVVASGDSAAGVMLEAYRATGSKVLYVNKVGDEKKAMRKRIRRSVSAGYDFAYDPPVPVAEAQAHSLDGETSLSRSKFAPAG